LRGKSAATALLFGEWRVPSMKKPVLGDELEVCRAWPKHLAEAPSPALQALAPLVSAAVADADAVVQALTDAQNANREFRLTGERKKLIDDVNSLRTSTYAFLKGYAIEHPELNLPSDFASEFFRKYRKSSRTTIEALDEQIVSLEADVAALRDQRALLVAARDAETKLRAETDKKAKQTQLEEAQKAEAEAAKRVLDLKSELGKLG